MENDLFLRVLTSEIMEYFIRKQDLISKIQDPTLKAHIQAIEDNRAQGLIKAMMLYIEVNYA